MAIQYSDALRNAQLDAIDAVVGPGPVLQLFSEALPERCASPDAGVVLCEITLPQEWLEPADQGVKSKRGQWVGFGQARAGQGIQAQHFRIKAAAGAACHIQGPIARGDEQGMALDNPIIAAGQRVVVDLFIVARGNR